MTLTQYSTTDNYGNKDITTKINGALHYCINYGSGGILMTWKIMYHEISRTVAFESLFAY